MIIENANSDDWAKIAALHVANWRTEYAGILPDEYLQNAVVKERRTYWQTALAKDDPDRVVILARDGPRLAGFAGLRIGVDKEAEATLDNLHVSKDQRGNGVGRKLFAQAAHQLSARDIKSVCLWVFDDNHKAIQFYERLGGAVSATGIDTLFGADAAHTQYIWTDLPALAERCDK